MVNRRIFLCIIAGTIVLVGCFKSQVSPTMPPSISVAQSQVNIDFKNVNGGSVSIKLVLPDQRTIQAFKEDITRYEGALYKDGNQLVTFTANAEAGAAVVNFLNLTEGDYTLKFKAFDAANQQVNKNAPDVDDVGTFTIRRNFKSRLINISVPLKDNAMNCPDGGLDVDIAAVTGIMQRHPRTPIVVDRSTTNEIHTLGNEAVVPSPIDDENHLNVSGEVTRTVNGVYSAFATNNDGENVRYLGRATFSSTTTDPDNQGNLTLIMSLVGKVKKFYFDANNNLQAVTDLTGTPAYFEYVDPEQAPGERYYSSLYPDGIDARRFFFLNYNRKIFELFFGANSGEGLIGAVLPDSELGIIHVQCLTPLITPIPTPTPSPTSSPSSYYVTTIAGSTAGYANGIGTNALFNRPYDIDVDNSDNIFVSDTFNSRIRKISPQGVVTTVAGSDYGYTDGIGENARFRFPNGLAVDGNGNIYVIDTNNFRIRKIDPNGAVTTIAGSSQGYADGEGYYAQFNFSYGITFDNGGDLIIGDGHNHLVRKITLPHTVSTVAGSTYGYEDGPAANAKFTYPAGVAVDSNGNIFVADGANSNRIRKITPQGVVSTFAGDGIGGGYQDGIGTNAKFTTPYELDIDQYNNLYVADGYRIRKISPQAEVTTIAGSTEGYEDGPGLTAKFGANSTHGIAVDANGVVYVADTANHRIRKLMPQYP